MDTIMEIAKPQRQKRQHSEEFRQAVVQACGEPGASVAGVALANGVNANLVRKWMAKRGVRPPGQSVRRGALQAAVSEFVPLHVAPASPPDIRIELCRGNTTVRIEWPVQAAGECGAWLREWLR
ncbi:transposase [Azoarcus sp. PA01]|nr:transposase [Azoarcus sp. PA01]